MAASGARLGGSAGRAATSSHPQKARKTTVRNRALRCHEYLGRDSAGCFGKHGSKQFGHSHEHRECCREDDPARKGVKESLSRRRAPIMRGNACARNAQAVGHDGHGDGRERKGGAEAAAIIQKVSEDDAQAEERDQRPDAAAGFGNLQRCRGQNDDIALAENRHPGECHHALADARRQELQRERDLIEDDRRNRNHQQEKRERKRENAQMSGAVDEQHDTGKRAEQREARHEEL